MNEGEEVVQLPGGDGLNPVPCVWKLCAPCPQYSDFVPNRTSFVRPSVSDRVSQSEDTKVSVPPTSRTMKIQQQTF